ncbi:MAG: hypothetical protein Q8918_08365, partial [Bacteroidota bacterium]|nr:hypothetical protein [Bacteroidota bacterium]
MKRPFLLLFCLISLAVRGQNVQPVLFTASKPVSVKPLEKLAVASAKGSYMKVYDGNGRQYALLPLHGLTEFVVGGALGRQMLKVFNSKGQITDTASFFVDASTDIDDGGYYKRMFHLFYNGMFADEKSGVSSIHWNGNQYDVFVPWVLDNFHTMKGKQYFLPNARELIDIMRQAQRADGMIYSFVQYMQNADYFLTRDKAYGYSKRIGDRVFVRQPTENHPEYIYVNTIYNCWKSEGDDEWMKRNLGSAAKALDYTVNDPARWSRRFQLLKRVYTIDSWDFEVDD